MKKFLSNKKLIPEAVALLVILGFVNSIGAISLSNGGLAQVFGTFSGVRPETRTYYVQDNNFGASEGLTFKQNKIVTIRACGAGGGGGAGDRGYEDGSNYGAGGGGGGGGGKGECESRQIKLRSGDTLRWQVGVGGVGGVGGNLVVITHDPAGNTEGVHTDTIATPGANGGDTVVSVNGYEVIHSMGGHGGGAGTSASSQYLPGWHGIGGSLDVELQQAWGHAGENGQNNNEQITPIGGMGNGGYGGNGEGQNGLLSNRGVGGTSYNPFTYGGDGGSGTVAGGGGGGGGGPGRWYDDEYSLNNSSEMYQSVQNHGGNGGNGGGGLVQFSW